MYELTQEQVNFIVKLLKDMSFQGNLEQREAFNAQCRSIIKNLNNPIKNITENSKEK